MGSELVLDVVARKTSKDLGTLADEFDRLAKETDDFGESTKKTTTFTKFLDDELANTKVRVKELGEEFDKTGSKDVFANLKGAQANLKSLEGIKKQITSALEPEPDQVKKSWLSALPSAEFLGEPMVAAIAYAIPAIPGLIGAAVTAGFGLGVIGGAAYLQKDSPALHAAFESVAEDAKKVFTDASSGTLAPLVAATQQFDGWLKTMGPAFRDVFQSVAPAIQPLERAFEAMLTPIINALPLLAEEFGKVFASEQMKRSFQLIGEQLGNLIGTIANNGRTIQLIFGMVAIAITVVVTLVDVLMNAFNALVASGERLVNFVSLGKVKFYDLAEGAKGAATAATAVADAVKNMPDPHAPESLAEKFQLLGEAERYADAQAENLSKTFDDLFSHQMSYDEAILKFKDDLSQLGDGIKQNGKSFDQNTAAGRANQELVLQMIQDAKNARDAQIAMAGGTGASKAAIDAANASYAAAIQQIEGVAGKAGIAQGALDQMAGNYQISITTTHYDVVAKPGEAVKPGGKIKAYADGGQTPANEWFLVGENGPELMRLGTQATVLPNQSSGYATPAAFGGASQQGQMQVTLNVAGGTDSAVAVMLRRLVQAGLFTIESRYVVG